MSSSYQSSYGASREITAAQRIAEIVCGRAAEAGGETLPSRFWTLPRWKSIFGRHVQAANRALKLYSEEAVFRALDKNPRFRSLVAAFVVDAIRTEQEVIDREVRAAEESGPTETHSTTEAPRLGVARGDSVKSRLKGL